MYSTDATDTPNSSVSDALPARVVQRDDTTVAVPDQHLVGAVAVDVVDRRLCQRVRRTVLCRQARPPRGRSVGRPPAGGWMTPAAAGVDTGTTTPAEYRAGRHVQMEAVPTADMVDPNAVVPLHTLPVDSPILLGVITLAALGATLLFVVSVAAFVQRRSRPYLLIVTAFAALLVRSAVAGFSLFGMLSPTSHHVLEHGLDVILVALVVAAVYYARGVSKGVNT
jgi:hypothetical protein